MSNNSHNGTYFIIGALSGAVAALLLAPRSGKETRSFIKKTIDDNQDTILKTKETAEDIIEKTKSQIEAMIENVSQNINEKIEDVTQEKPVKARTARKTTKKEK